MVPEIEKLILNYPILENMESQIEDAVQILANAYRNGGKLLACGNGGSAADCEHIVGELLKEFKIRRPFPKEMKDSLLTAGAPEGYTDHVYGALPAISLASHVGFLTAFMNDADSDYIFAQQLYALGKRNDVLLAISTSGNSENIVNAAIMAKAMQIKVIGLTGETGGKLRDYCDVILKAPEQSTARIQELHLPIYHVICELLELQFFDRVQ